MAGWHRRPCAAFTLVPHTLTQDPRLHPHVHALMACGALGRDAQGQRLWQAPKRSPTFLFPVRALSEVFKAKFMQALLALPAASPAAAEAANEFTQRVAGIDVTRCPHCTIGRWLTIGCQAPLRSIHTVGGGIIGNGSSAGDSSHGSPACRGPP